MDRTIRFEERRARKEGRAINPEEIERLTERILARLHYKTRSAHYHSFVGYFHNLIRLGWVEPSGKEEPSGFQEHYPPGSPRRYYRLTAKGVRAPASAWVNPLATLYGPREPRAKPLAPPPQPPIAPARPPLEIPAFDVAEKASRGASERLIAHLRKVGKVGLAWPEAQTELKRLAGEVSGWASLVSEAADKEEEKEEPDEDRLEALRGRDEALEQAVKESWRLAAWMAP